VSHNPVAMVTGDVRLTRVSTVPIGVESNCVLCEAHTEAEETHFITETEFFCLRDVL